MAPKTRKETKTARAAEKAAVDARQALADTQVAIRSLAKARQNLKQLGSVDSASDSNSKNGLDEIDVLSTDGHDLPALDPWYMGKTNFSEWALENLPTIAGQEMVVLDNSCVQTMGLLSSSQAKQVRERIRGKHLRGIHLPDLDDLFMQLQKPEVKLLYKALHETSSCFVPSNPAENESPREQRRRVRHDNESNFLWTMAKEFADMWRSNDSAFTKERLERWWLVKVHGPLLSIFDQFQQLHMKISEAESHASVEVFNQGRQGKKTSTFRHDAVGTLSHLGIDLLLMEAAKAEDFKKCEEDRSKIQIGLACALLHIYWTLPEWAKDSFKDISVYGILMAGLSVTLHEARWTTQGVVEIIEVGHFKILPDSIGTSSLLMGCLEM
ncbi:hypothetical protein BGX34_000217, partial [Mortierella sp. NVP85]